MQGERYFSAHHTRETAGQPCLARLNRSPSPVIHVSVIIHSGVLLNKAIPPPPLPPLDTLRLPVFFDGLVDIRSQILLYPIRLARQINTSSPSRALLTPFALEGGQPPKTTSIIPSLRNSTASTKGIHSLSSVNSFLNSRVDSLFSCSFL
jgi:hypothetical protein